MFIVKESFENEYKNIFDLTVSIFYNYENAIEFFKGYINTLDRKCYVTLEENNMDSTKIINICHGKFRDLSSYDHNNIELLKYKVYDYVEGGTSNLKSMYRERLRKLQEFIKITKLSEEFGLKYNTLSAFLKSDKNDSIISEEKLHDLCLYIENRISELIR